MATLIVVSGLLATFGTTEGLNQSGTPEVIWFGTDHTFLFNPNPAANQLNVFDDETLCTGGASCTVVPGAGSISTSASVSNDPRTRNGETLIGVTYDLRKRCDQQNIQPEFEAIFGYEGHLDTDNSLTGESTAAFNLRAKTKNDIPLEVEKAQNGQDIDTTIPETIVILPNLTTYVSTLGASAHARVLADVPQQNDFATASAEAQLSSVKIAFRDDTPPTISSVTIDRTDGVGASTQTGFKGWFKHHPNLTVVATDPIVQVNANNEEEIIPHSCVSHALIDDDGTNFGRVDANYLQAMPKREIWENGRFELGVTVYDFQGNHIGGPQTELGVDDKAPLTSVSINRATNGFRDGVAWYKGPSDSAWPSYTITCDDTNGLPAVETSGCLQANHSLSNAKPKYNGNPINIAVQQGTGVSITVHSMDLANNGAPKAPSAATNPVNVDMYGPNATFGSSIPTTFPNIRWWNQSVTIDVGCSATGEISGCFTTRTNLNGAGFTDQVSLPFTVESSNSLVVNTEDKAGNGKNATFDVGLDFTAPPKVKFPKLNPPGVQREDLVVFQKVVPRYEWTAPTDGLSGVQQYRVLLDGVFVANTTSTFYTPTIALDGNHTISVAAVDKAGNVGEFQSLTFFLDRVKPKNHFDDPLVRKLYVNGRVVADLPPVASQTSDWTLVIGGIRVKLTAFDPGVEWTNASGMLSTRMQSVVATGGVDPKPCEAGSTASVCEWDDPADFDVATPQISKREMQGISEDRATNSNWTFLNYTKVDLGLLGRFVTNPTTGQSQASGASVYWMPVSGATAYEIWRSTTPGFVFVESSLTGTARLDTVGTGVDEYFDDPADLTSGKTYYYAVRALTAGLPQATHNAKLVYGTDVVSSAFDCDARGVCK